MPGRLHLELATPTRLLVSEEVDEVVAPGALGSFGVLPGHAPFLTTLGVGEVIYRQGSREHYLAVTGGFAEVGPERVIVLTETAERPEEIDVERARAALERADGRLAGRAPEEIDYERALRSRTRAATRIQVAARR